MIVSAASVSAVLFLFDLFAGAVVWVVVPPPTSTLPEHNKPYNEQVKMLAGVLAGLGLSLIGFGAVQPLFRGPGKFGPTAVFSIAAGLALILSSLLLLRLILPAK
jgi:hypothetical protein